MRLVYLMGPSGAGKDSLLQAAAQALAERGYHLAPRCVTRVGVSNEPLEEWLSEEVFAARQAAGDFALCWQANGLSYGVPRQIDDWLQAGQTVLVNGSRGYLSEARRRYPNLQAICLEAPIPQLRERLLKRGRETARQVEERLLRHQQLQAALRDAGAYCVVEAGGSLEKSVEALLACLDEPGQPTCS
jgi:ribose 1,5-bisphosphokinase